MARWLKHCQNIYRQPDGSLTDTYSACETVVKKHLLPLAARRLGDLTRADLVAVQENMIKTGTIRAGKRIKFSRKTLREYLGAMKRLIKYGRDEGCFDASQAANLLNLPAIRANDGRKSKRVQAIPMRDVFKLYRSLHQPWQDIFAFHILTGQRVETVLRAQPSEIDTNAEPWKYSPTVHKTTWRGHDLTILIGPRARRVLAPLMATRGYFWPAKKMNAKEHLDMANPRTASAYKNALQRACERAAIPIYTPQQIRHTTATWLIGRGVSESIIGAILGHHGRGDDDSLSTGSTSITGRYAAVPRRRVEAVVEKWG